MQERYPNHQLKNENIQENDFLTKYLHPSDDMMKITAAKSKLENLKAAYQKSIIRGKMTEASVKLISNTENLSKFFMNSFKMIVYY